MIAVFDASKWTQTAMNLCATFQDVDTIITNASVSVNKDTQEVLDMHQIQMILTP